MTKNEYMSLLKSKLVGFDEEVVAEIIQDYDEHFSLGYTQHKGDDEIIASLGSIDELVKEMEQCYDRHKSNSIQFDFSNLNESFSLLKDNLKEMGKNLKEELKDVDIKFGFDFDDSSYHHSNDFDFEDLHSQKFSFTGDIKKIIIDGFLGEIEARNEEQLIVEYECEGSKKDKLMFPLYTGIEDDVLTIKVQELSTYNSIKNKTPDMRLFLGVPSWIEEIQIINCQDTISIEEIQISKLSCDTQSADIEIRESCLNQCSLNSISGDMTIDNCKANELSIDTISGNIEVLENILGKAAIATTSGDIELVDGTSRMVSIKTVSGDINCNSSCCEAYSLFTTSGDIEVTVDGESALQLDSKSGDVDIELLASVNGFIAATKSISGDINIEFDDFCKDELPNGIYQYSKDNNEMEVKIKVETTSGDISIHE